MESESKHDLLSLNLDELTEYIVNTLGQPKFRALQVYEWLSKGASFDEMTNIPKKMISDMKESAEIRFPEIYEKYSSKIDSTVKFLYKMYDGQLVESVVMKYEHGYSICLSTQAGCRMGCRFCASTIGGKVRDLSAGEILSQVIIAQKNLGIRISNIVLMGIGEPLDNYDNVLKFLRLVNSEKGLNIGSRHISLSTCGLVDRIYSLAKEDLQITLSISLHASTDEVRSEIMPINKKYPLDKLLTACRDYFDMTGRRISFEYTLITGKNDSQKDAEDLSSLLKKYLEKRPFHINLIPVNEVTETEFKRGNKASVNAFCNTLTRLGINATVRRTLGSDINASCGQLRHNAAKA